MVESIDLDVLWLEVCTEMNAVTRGLKGLSRLSEARAAGTEEHRRWCRGKENCTSRGFDGTSTVNSQTDFSFQ